MGTFSDAAKNQMVDNVAKGTASPFAGVVYVKLHTGDPGATGASNPATETTRKAVTFGAAAAGAIVSNSDVVWTLYPAPGDTLTWASFWDAAVAGNFLGRDDFPSSKVVAQNDTVTLPAGNLTLAV